MSAELSPDKKEELVVGLSKRGIIKFGESTLKSGRKSPIYYNQRPLLSVDHNLGMTPSQQRELASLAVKSYADKVRTLQGKGDTQLYGIPQAATAIGAVVARETDASYLWGRVGKKDYGKHEAIERSFLPESSVIQIDDVVTNADSKIVSAANLAEAGLETSGFVVMLDRQEGGEGALALAGHTMESVLTMSDVALILDDNRIIGSRELDALVEYHEDLRAEGVGSTYSYGS